MVAKLAITVFATVILLIKMELIGHAARLLVLLVLLVPPVLSISKPRGFTPFRKRVQPEQCTPSQRPRRLSLRPSIDFSKSVTITLPRAYVPAFVFVMLVAHVVVMHLAGIGLAVH